MDFKESHAIYLQIVDYMGEQILANKWLEHERVPSVRELGILLQVNPNTAMRSYEFLQGMGIIYNKRGVGYFVDEQARPRILEYRKEQFRNEVLPQFFKHMQLLHITIDEVAALYKQYSNKLGV